MKLFLFAFIVLLQRINCDRGYAKAMAPSQKSSAQIGLTVGIEKEEVFLKKDPGQLWIQLGDNGPSHSSGGYKKASSGGYGGGGHGGGGYGGGGHGGGGYSGGDGGHGGDYEGSYGGGGGDGKVYTSEYSGGYSSGHDGGYDGGHDSSYGSGGCGGCYSSGSEAGGAYYKLGATAQKQHGKHAYKPLPKPVKPYNNVQSYVVERYTSNDYQKQPSYSSPPTGKHYKAGNGGGKMEIIKLGNGDSYEDSGLVVSSGKYVKPTYDYRRMGDLPNTQQNLSPIPVEETYSAPELEIEDSAENRRSEVLDFGSVDFHNQYYNEMMASQGLFGHDLSSVAEDSNPFSLRF